MWRTRVFTGKDQPHDQDSEFGSTLIHGIVDAECAGIAPVSTDLWRYERALEEAGLPFASQAGKNLFRRQEAQDLVALIRALTDPRDALALRALRRGPLVGLTEQELSDITASLPTKDYREEIVGLSLRTDPNGHLL